MRCLCENDTGGFVLTFDLEYCEKCRETHGELALMRTISEEMRRPGQYKDYAKINQLRGELARRIYRNPYWQF